MCDSRDGIESSIAITCVTRPGAKETVINSIIFNFLDGIEKRSSGVLHMRECFLVRGESAYTYVPELDGRQDRL